MSHSRFFVSALGACTLWAAAACSTTGARDDARPSPAASATVAGGSSGVTPPASAAQVPSSSTTATGAPSAATPGAALPNIDARDTEPGSSAHSARPSSIQVLSQMLTTQALLVSLLLTPLSQDTAEQPLARVDAP